MLLWSFHVLLKCETSLLIQFLERNSLCILGFSTVFVTDVNGVNLDDYNIHVIASVLKQWLRDLPNPLMTFELYEEFLRAMGMSLLCSLSRLA